MPFFYIRTKKESGQLAWIIHESRLPQVQGAEGEAVDFTANTLQRSKCGKIGSLGG